MNADRWRKWALAAIGAMLLMLTGVGLWRQHAYDTDGFTVLGALGIAVGLGFGFSAVASYLLSRSFGLLGGAHS